MAQPKEAYRDVFQPLLVKVPVRAWEGILWRHVFPTHLHTYTVGIQALGGLLQIAYFDGPAVPNRERVEVVAWDAFATWTAWAYEVARKGGFREIPKTWTVLSSYPGRSELVHKRWIAIARQTRCSWEEWQVAAELMAIGELPLTKNGMEVAIGQVMRSSVAEARARIAEAKRKREAGPPPSTKLPPGAVMRDFPPDWERALTKICRGVKPNTRSVYRSRIRFIAREAGTFDLEQCKLLTDRMPPNVQAVWARFLRAHEPDLVVGASAPDWVLRKENATVKRKLRQAAYIPAPGTEAAAVTAAAAAKPSHNHDGSVEDCRVCRLVRGKQRAAERRRQEAEEEAASMEEAAPVQVVMPAGVMSALQKSREAAVQMIRPAARVEDLPRTDDLQAQIRHAGLSPDQRDWLVDHMLKEADRSAK